jgi:energy-coupling factor transporter transmembrane protein EcfT
MIIKNLKNWFYMGIVWFMALFDFYVTTFIILLPWLEKKIFWLIWIIYIVLGLLFMISFLRASFTDPGHPSIYINNSFTLYNKEENWCDYCQIYKPIRTHHCKKCHRCVLKMDHHCTWINNCVGFKNYKFFFLTLVYAEVGVLFMISLVIIRWIFVSIQWNIQNIIIIIYTIGLSIQLIFQTFLLSFHIYFISKNMTTIDWYCCRGKGIGHSFDRGIYENIKDVLGGIYLCWCCPVNVSIAIDGINFIPTNILIEEENKLKENQDISDRDINYYS